MDINQVSESISTTNELVANAVTAQTELANDLTEMSVTAKVQGQDVSQLVPEAGKGVFLDSLV